MPLMRRPISRSTFSAVQSGCCPRIAPRATSYVKFVQRKQHSNRCCGVMRRKISNWSRSADLACEASLMPEIIADPVAFEVPDAANPGGARSWCAAATAIRLVVNISLLK